MKYAPLAPLSVDFLRAQLLTDNQDLIAIVLGRVPVYVFDGRPRCPLDAICTTKQPCELHRLEHIQFEFEDDSVAYSTTKSVERVLELAARLPRTAKQLRRGATGWRDRHGVVHRFALDNPELTADVMRAELAQAPTI